MGSFLAATLLLAAALLHGGSASTYESECSPTSFVGGSYSTNSYVILGFQGVPNFYTYQSNFFLSDSTCVTPDLTIRLVGMFTRGADGSYPTVDKNGVPVSTTTTIDTVWTAWSAFAYNDNGAMFLEDQCNITNVMMGENIDLFPTGCSFYGLPPHADCPVYYDVLDAHTDHVLLGYDDMTFGVCDSMDRSTVVDNTEVYTILPPLDIATMDYTTGDFGGMAFPMRDEFETYIETDAMGDVISYGFYMPINSRSGMSALPFTDVSRGAALAFNTSMLAMPEQMPFKFIGINYNPGGHPGLEYLIPHYDIHVWLHPKEYAIGIQCDGAFPPCVTTPYLAEKFGKLPDQMYYPMNYTTDASEYVPTMGAHLIPNPIPNTFDMEPAYIFGSYDGELIYYEPMISNAVFDQIPAGGELVFNWPMVDAYPKPGKYFTKIRLSVEGTDADGRYKIAFTDLMDAPETSRGRSVYFGMVEVPSLGQIQNAVSMKKDCVIATDEVVDAGWTVVSGGESYCCRARGMMDQGSCIKSSCGNTKPLTNPVDAYFSDSMDCYASCYMRN